MPQAHLTDLHAQLAAWNVPQLLAETARKRGMSDSQFAEFWHNFVSRYQNRRNAAGLLILASPDRTLQWSFKELREAGWPPLTPRSPSRPTAPPPAQFGPEWQLVQATTKSGRHLHWHVCTKATR